MAESNHVFTFGDPESVLDSRELMHYIEIWHNGRWYEPPIPIKQLNRAFRMASAHESAIKLKRNLLTKTFKPHRWLSRKTFKTWVQDWLVTGNGYLERIDNMAGRPQRLKHSPAVHTRVGMKEGQFFFLQNKAGIGGEPHEFAQGTLHHLIEPDQDQEIYGMPEYLSALQSGLLNEDATLFRRKYFKNGAHVGSAFYLSEPSMSDEDVEAFREALKSAKGPGNFRNLFMHAPNGKKDGLQIIPIAEHTAKDLWTDIKRTSRDDLLTAHRTPPPLLGIVPENNGGFGDIRSASMIFFEHEIMPLQESLKELNEWLGLEVIRFDAYEPPIAGKFPPQPSGSAK